MSWVLFAQICILIILSTLCLSFVVDELGKISNARHNK